MSLLSAVQGSFDMADRIRGNVYYSQGRVQRVATRGTRAKANVCGTGRDYTVTVDWNRIEQGVLAVHCDCPRFQTVPCKHAWAFLRVLEAGQRLPVQSHSLQLVELSGGQSMAPGPKPSQNAPAAEDWPNSTFSVTRLDWRTGLDLVSRGSSVETSGHDLGQTTNSYCWWVIDVPDSLRNDCLALSVYRRALHADGWGPPVRCLPYEIPSGSAYANDEESLLCHRLSQLISRLDRHVPAYSARPFVDRRESGYLIRLPVAICDSFLPALCRTGRFAWSLNPDGGASQWQEVRLDDTGPFRPTVVGEEAEDTHGWQLRGVLCRGEEQIDAEQIVLHLQTGWALLPDRLIQLSASSIMHLFREFARGVRLFVAREEAASFRRMWWQHGDPDDTNLPAPLQCERVDAEPSGVVSIRRHGSTKRKLRGDLCFRYDRHYLGINAIRHAYDAESNRWIRRQRHQEAALLDRLRECCRSLPDVQTVGTLLECSPDRLPQLVTELRRRGWEAEVEGQLLREVGEFRLSVRSEFDWFDVSADVRFEGVSIAFPKLLEAIRKGEKFVTLDDGSQGVLPEKWMKQLSNWLPLGEKVEDGFRFRHSQALLLDALLAEHPQTPLDRQFEETRQRLQSFRQVGLAEEPRGFQGRLREYQQRGLGWMKFLQEYGLGGCLADDMGLGKTIQVLALLQSRRLRGARTKRPSLVVVPKSLIFNWVEEARRFTPRLKVLPYIGLQRQEHLESLSDYDLVLTTYGTLRRDIQDLMKIEFDYAILDEAQAIKNAKSQASKACRLIHSQYRLALSGTPVENHLGELWALFDFLNPGLLGRAAAFQSFSRSATQDDQNLEVLRRIVAPFILRRTKEEVLPDLPEKLEQTLYCELSGKERKQYDELKNYYRGLLTRKIKDQGLARSKMHVLEALLRLRQAACHPGLVDPRQRTGRSAKLEVLFEHLAEVTAEGHKALVFSQFTSLLDIVRRQVEKNGVTYEYLDGATQDRQQRVRRFQEDPDCPLFLISLKAGGQGLNLTAADYVFILDPWWNPAVEAQAVDRAHRIGQDKRVFAYRLIARDTVEEKVLQLQRTKKALAEAVITNNENLIRRLSTEDLELLLG